MCARIVPIAGLGFLLLGCILVAGCGGGGGSSGGSGSGGGVNGGTGPSGISFYGLCYGPFSGVQNPKTGPFPTANDMASDLRILSPYTTRVRVYSALGFMKGFTQLAASQGLEALVGCWISSDRTRNNEELQALIDEAKLGKMKRGIVGNEVLLRGDLPKKDLIDLMKAFKTATGLPVSTAETFQVWMDNPDLVEASDFITVHIHGYWDGVAVDNAAQYVINRYEELKAKYPGKEIIIGETGWPTGGPTRGLAVPSVQNQQKFLSEFTKLANAKGIKYYYFEAFDEAWKVEEEGEVGGKWGVYFLKREERGDPTVISKFPFVVYDDFKVTANFVPSGWMGDTSSITLDPECTVTPHSGTTCIKIVYKHNPAGKGWAGIYWVNIEGNWGQFPGYKFRGVRKLTFWARGHVGGEKAEFKVGGIDSGRTYKDSLPTQTTGVVTLSVNWRKYEIPIPKSDLDCVISGFCWVGTTSSTIYIDDIIFE